MAHNYSNLYLNISNISYEYDTSLINYPKDALKSLPAWEVALKILIYVIIIILSLLGNISLIIVVVRNRRMWTTTNYYIVNLAVSDLMITLWCQWVHLVDDITDGWILGAFFCKLNSFSQVLSMVCSIMTLTLIACDRFFGIVFAMKAHFVERNARYSLVFIWICAISFASPLLYYRNQEQRQWLNHKEIWCDDTWSKVMHIDLKTKQSIITYPSRTIYYTLLTTVLYFLPICIMTFAYAFIIYTLWSKVTPGEVVDKSAQMQVKRRKKVIVMLIVLLLTFIICWSPLVIKILFNEYRSNKNHMLPNWFQHFEYFAVFIANANSALNPIIYTAYSDNFRKGFRDTFMGRLHTSHYQAVAIQMGGLKTNACQSYTTQTNMTLTCATTNINQCNLNISHNNIKDLKQ